MSIILASYNSGIGHVNDASAWHGSTARSQFVGGRGPLPATQGAARVLRERGGQVRTFTGSRQTLAYVNDVIGRYDKYCRIARR